MDKNNDNQQSPDIQQWLDHALSSAEQTDAIGPDEHAVYSAGLSNIEDADLEKILAEDWFGDIPQELLEESTEGQADISSENAPVPAEIFESSTEVTAAPEDENTEEEPIPPQKKGRPKAKKGYGLLGIPHILATAIWLALILAVGLSLGRVLWVCCADLMAFGKEPQKVTITITETDTIETISEKLGKANLVRYPGLFQLFAEITGKDENISVGTFTLSSQLDYNAMINAMVYYGSTREVVDVLFPEGVNCAQIFKILENHNVCTVAELEEYAANGELGDYWFLEGIERGDKYCLEGYLAPDTYKFYTNDEPRRVLEKFLNEFDDRFTDKMKADLATMQQTFAEKLVAKGVDPAYIEANPLNLAQIVTLASIIQRETSSGSECYDISSVFYNRLTDPNYLYLDSDATVYYAIGDYFGEVEELTDEHLNTISPYNTRNTKGIPVGPICNMGVDALYAALEPNDTNYYYFVFDADRNYHLFSSTYDEHMRHVAELED